MYNNRMALIIRLFSESFPDIYIFFDVLNIYKKFSLRVERSANLVRGTVNDQVESSDDHAGVQGERAQEPLHWFYPYCKRLVDWKLIQGETF